MAHRQNASPESCELPACIFFHIFHMPDKCLAPASVSSNPNISSASHVDPSPSNVDPSSPNIDPSPPYQDPAPLIRQNPLTPRDDNRHFSSTSSLTSLENNQNDESDSDKGPPRTPTPESTYSEGEERLSVRCARFILTEDPSYTEALEGYRLFPERPEFKLTVEKRNHQRYYETEEWALSALKQRRNLLQLCEHRLTPKQVTRIEAEIYPHRPRKPLSAKRLELLKNVPSFSIMAPQTSDPIPDEEIIKPMIAKQKKRLAEFLAKSKSKSTNTSFSQVCKLGEPTVSWSSQRALIPDVPFFPLTSTEAPTLSKTRTGRVFSSESEKALLPSKGTIFKATAPSKKRGRSDPATTSQRKKHCK